jgi:hypothetical protein
MLPPPARRVDQFGFGWSATVRLPVKVPEPTLVTVMVKTQVYGQLHWPVFWTARSGLVGVATAVTPKLAQDWLLAGFRSWSWRVAQFWKLPTPPTCTINVSW